MDTRNENCDYIVYAIVDEIRSIFMRCPDKYGKTIKCKFFRSQVLYLAIGLAVAIILSLFTKFSLMPKYEIVFTALNNKVVFVLAFIFVAELSGILMGNGIIASMYKRISSKQKYSGYNRNPPYREAVELAKEKGVTFRNIDIAKDREEQGLDTLSPEMKKQLCRRILYTYCQNEQYGVQECNYAKFVNEFIENNYEDFAEKQLKMLPESNKELKIIDTVDNKTNNFTKSLQDLKK